MKRLLTACFLLTIQCLYGAESLNPSISPSFFQSNTIITVVYDVTGTSLANLTNAYAWVWIPGKNTNAVHNINPASPTNPSKFTKSISNGRTLFTLTFTPSTFFSTSITNEVSMGILLKGPDWSNGQTTDFIASFWDGTYGALMESPSSQPLFVSNGESIEIEAETPVASNFELFINNSSVNTQLNVLNYSYSHFVSETSGFATVKLVATAGPNSDTVSFQYLISAASPISARPSGIIPGINYHGIDHTQVTLCLWAPGKSSAYVMGDFSDWLVLPEYLMMKDGEFFWIELTGLTPGFEYAFQYLIEEITKVADPYADKILDPDDQYIPSATYPGLKPFPAEALNSQWYFNRVAVFQTNRTPYIWQTPVFTKPSRSGLVIYELLLRDFFANGERNYQNLIDTITYFKRLGINAIELMPIMEFNGNEGWGYNPTFMFAPDKYYGTKNKLKEFVDKCHENGIAVILDIAMNHHDLPNPYVMMDFNFTAGKPATNNKWFNVDARHPFNVFFDMNHESNYTKQYLDTVAHYWLNEYHVDGYRFDLSKGFTQTNNPFNVDAWGAYDPTRIAILKRMADKIWEHSPDAYVILEHFAQAQEEKELAEYRLNEGKGMMIWGNLNYAYGQLTMGYSDGADISSVYHENRNWDVAHLVGYMESHDEERAMYRNLLFGESSGNYNVRLLNTALHRMKAAATLFLTIPGPKMIWQFGELGYDYSINRCSDGSINSNCRLDSKPVVWDYKDVPARQSLFDHIGDLNRLRKSYDVFVSGIATVTAGANLTKQITLRNDPYTASPTDATEMNVQIVANFDVVPVSASVTFPHIGTWFDYYAYGDEAVVGSSPMTIQLAPGEFRMFTDVEITNEIILNAHEPVRHGITVYPNPIEDILMTESDEFIVQLNVMTPDGRKFSPLRLSGNSWDISELPAGLLITEVLTKDRIHRIKIIKAR